MRTTISMLAALLLSPIQADLAPPAVPEALTGIETARDGDSGIRFACPGKKLDGIEAAMDGYLREAGIGPALVVKKRNRRASTLLYTLNSPPGDEDTLTLAQRPELAIHDQLVSLPAHGGTMTEILTVSQKEILLALLQHGRLSEFNSKACDLEALKDHVGIRQNIVAWAENLDWGWPEGEAAVWNARYWRRGTPQPGFPLHEAVNDVFINQQQYSFGCYTATKLVVIQGVLDYYHRIKGDAARLKLVEARLSADQEPLVDIEPGKMWSFEADFDPQELDRPGKILAIQYHVAPNNIVPGDWTYFLNTDPVSYQKTGYEGSNAIYMGRNKFDDYYNDNQHAYTYKQKLDEVFQWRNGVFSRARDFAKIETLGEQDFARLRRTPAQGGIVTDLRVFPYFFGEKD